MSAPRVGRDRMPTTAGLERWVDAIGNVTTPLLAGFSVTPVIVVRALRSRVGATDDDGPGDGPSDWLW